MLPLQGVSENALQSSYLPSVGISTHLRNRRTIDAVSAKIMKFNYEVRKKIKLL